MTDDDLRRRFHQLRAEEARAIPRFRVAERRTPRRLLLALSVSLLLMTIVLIVVPDRPSPTTFSAADRAVVESIGGWRPPTDFLLQTPGDEMLTSTPVIPEPMKGASP